MTDPTFYLLLVHRSPSHLRRLANRLLEDGSSVLIHVDEGQDIEPFRQALSELDRVSFCEERFRSGWGTYALVEAELALLRQALELGPFSHAVLISGQDYPITSTQERRRFFEEGEHRSFMSWSDGTGSRPPTREGNESWFWDGNLNRVAFKHYWLTKTPHRNPITLIPKFPKRRPPGGRKIYQGSQWWALDPMAARLCVDALNSDQQLTRYFRGALGPDEYVFQTLLLNSPLSERAVNFDLIYQDFDGWHARAMTLDDVPKMGLSRKLFARKVDMEMDPTVADAIDARLVRTD